MDRMISGIKPTGKPTLGNYLGAIKQFITYQNDYELFVFIADLHALTLPIDQEELRENIKDLVAIYLAAGLDPNKVVIFKQSDVPAHNQLEWILTCNTNLAELTKMPQYKNFLEQHKNEAIPSGMLMYPSLMNADIILYDAKYVPVGIDQKPHIDLTRDIVDKFNKRYPNSFIAPEAILARSGAKIMSLSDPTKKMSKSESDKGTIYLFDSKETVFKKFRKATTDSEGRIYFNPETKPGISNLLTIASAITGKSISDIEEMFKDSADYGAFKTYVAEVVWEELSKVQNRVELFKHSSYINKVLHLGATKANWIAEHKINYIYTKLGLKDNV